jgi:hypothetical protein
VDGNEVDVLDAGVGPEIKLGSPLPPTSFFVPAFSSRRVRYVQPRLEAKVRFIGWDAGVLREAILVSVQLARSGAPPFGGPWRQLAAHFGPAELVQIRGDDAQPLAIELLTEGTQKASRSNPKRLLRLYNGHLPRRRRPRVARVSRRTGTRPPESDYRQP